MRLCPSCQQLVDDALELCPSDQAALLPPDPLLGRTLDGKYHIDAMIGAGGMGTVYRATQVTLKRTVAIKFLKLSVLSDPRSRARFEREALVLAGLKHPNIITVHDFGVAPEIGAYLVMEFVEGRSLFDEIAIEGRLTEARAIELTRQVCRAVVEAHAGGVIHRDLKPFNIMLESTREGDRVKVLDFGLARLHIESPSPSDAITQEGIIVGTAHYLAPELSEGAQADARSDVYALGCILYEMLVGQPPFVADTAYAVLTMHATVSPVSPSVHVPDLLPSLEAVVLGALAKNPADRFQTAAELDEALEDVVRDAAAAAGDTMATMIPRRAVPRVQAVGQEAEYAEIAHRLQQADRGECQFVVVAGEAGTGKSLLVDSIAELASGRGIRVLRGRFVDTDHALPYSAFCDIVQEFLRSNPDAADRLASLAPDLVALFPVLGEFGVLSVEGAAGVSDPKNQTAIFETLAATLARIAGERTLVVVLEDLHASDTSVEALPYLVRRLAPARLLVLGTYRSEEVDRRHPVADLVAAFRNERRFALVELAPLEREVHRRLVDTIVGGPVEARLAEQLHVSTEGNPYFTKELVRSLLESGDLVQSESGTWRLLSGSVSLADAMPVTVQEVVRRRTEALPERAREILTTASVIGREFDYEDLAALEGDDGDLEAVVDDLIERGLLEEERRSKGDRLAFASEVVREVFYAGLRRRRRRALHRTFAEALEARYRGREGRVLPALVHHFAEGDVAEKAVAYGLRLAARALRARAGADAIRAARTVLDFVGEEGEWAEEGRARRMLAEAHCLLGEGRDALREFEAAAAAFERADARTDSIAVMAAAAETAWEIRRTEDACRWVERGLAATRRAWTQAPGRDDAEMPAEGADVAESRRRLLMLAATVASLASEYDRARAYLDEAERLRPAGSQLAETPAGHDAGSAEQRDLAPERTDPSWSSGAASPVERSRADLLPRRGRNVLKTPTPEKIRDLDPSSIQSLGAGEVLSTVFETLVRVGTSAQVEPWLAEAYWVEERGRRLRFRLREGVRFHDGRRLTAHDVRHSFERLLSNPVESLQTLISIRGAREALGDPPRPIEGIRVLSDLEFTIDLEEALANFLVLLADTAIAIVPQGTGRIEGTWRAGCVGTGPFRVVRHDPDRLLELEANPLYWRTGYPATDGLIFSLGVPLDEHVAGVRDGRYSLAWDIRPAEAEELRHDDTLADRIHQRITISTYYLAFNAHGGPLSDEATRRRVVAAVGDVTSLVEEGFGRSVVPAHGLIPPGLLGHEPGPRSTLERSASADDGSGTLRLELTCVAVPTYWGRFEQVLTKRMGAAGIDLRIDRKAGAEWLDAVQSASVDMALGGWMCDCPDAHGMVYPLLHSRAGLHAAMVGTEEVDRLAEQGCREQDPETRHRIYQEIEEIIRQRALLLPLYHRQTTVVTAEDVEGVELNLFPPYVSWEKLRFRRHGR